MEKAIGYLDLEIGKIWDAIQYREKNFKEDWFIIITTDHGRDATTGKNHGGQSDRERTTWMVSNLKNTNAYFQQNNPAIVDILPSIARFQNIEIPRLSQYELDGVPIIGPVSLSNARVEKQGDSLILHWKAYEKKGKVKIFLSPNNNFKKGNSDTYQTIALVPLNTERFAIKIDAEMRFVKFILEANKNTVNTHWINPAIPK
jgi:arylsulfatase A-like enzyme